MGSDKKKTVPNPLAALQQEAERMQSETTRKVAPSPLMDLDEPELERTPMRVAISTADLLTNLDEPTFAEVNQAPSTKRPEYEPDQFALHVESAADRMTAPPSPTYEMLRDSCTSAIAEEVPLDEEQILRPSSRKVKVPPGR